LLAFVRISIGIMKIIIDFTMITVFIITLTFFYKLTKLKKRNLTCLQRFVLAWAYLLAINMYAGSVMVFSSRILRSFGWHTIAGWKTYLLILRELYWPIAHFANAVTLAVFFKYQTDSVL